MWVCGWDADANRTWHSPTSTISVRTISSWFCWFFYIGSYVDSHHIENHQQLHKQLFSPVCFQSAAFYALTLLAFFVLLASIFTFPIKGIKPVCSFNISTNSALTADADKQNMGDDKWNPVRTYLCVSVCACVCFCLYFTTADRLMTTWKSSFESSLRTVCGEFRVCSIIRKIYVVFRVFSNSVSVCGVFRVLLIKILINLPVRVKFQILVSVT